MSDIDPILKRMETLMTFIDAAIVSCNSDNDRLMLACAMLQRTKNLFDALLGEEGRKEMIRSLYEEEN